MIWAVACVTVLFMLSGCTGGRSLLEKPVKDPVAIQDFISSEREKLVSMESDLTLAIRSPELNTTVYGHMKYERPGRLFTKLHAAMGVNVGRLLVTERYFELIMSDGRVMNGLAVDLDLELYTGIPFPSGNVFDILDPQPATPHIWDVTESFKVREDSVVEWVLDEGAILRQIWVDSLRGRILKERWLDSETQEELIEIRYKKYAKIHDVTIASKYVIESFGDQNTLIEVEFDHVQINKEWEENPFQFKTIDLP